MSGLSGIASTASVGCRRIDAFGRLSAISRDIAEEVPVSIIFNELYPYAVMMASPADLEDFARGFALTEQIVPRPDNVAAIRISTVPDGIELHVRITGADLGRLMQRGRAMTGRTGCGICGIDKLETLRSSSHAVPAGGQIRLSAIRRALGDLRAHQTLNERTHMVHAAAWATKDGQIALVREDVGRHNALDKLIGARTGHGLNFAEGFCVLTSRYSFEMAEKAAIAGMACVVAISAPTARALRVAQNSGQTVVAIARADGQIVFEGADRIVMDCERGDIIDDLRV